MVADSARPLLPASTARVSFRQPVSVSGFVDGGWWPRSRDLTAELPSLLDVLWTASREISRVSYNLDFWVPAPRQLMVEGRLVRLGGYRQQSPLLLGLVDLWGRERIDLLVVPPETAAEVAEPLLLAASATGGLDRPEALMAHALPATAA
ncbi:MAG: hypothetical protein JWN95_2276 [Frankiales bacterium]|nr:hypothetical protein [Frankiales bacterium]